MFGPDGGSLGGETGGSISGGGRSFWPRMSFVAYNMDRINPSRKRSQAVRNHFVE
jgi:hypothetical protein